MALSDIFNMSLLAYLGITLLIVSIVSILFLQRLNVQNHKISSMLGLVTTMADELNFVRSKVHQLSYQVAGGITVDPNINNQSSNSNSIKVVENYINKNELIEVSDDEDDSDDDENDSEVEDSDDEVEDSDDEDEDIDTNNNNEDDEIDSDDDIEEIEDDSDDEDEQNTNNIKVINLSEDFDINESLNPMHIDNLASILEDTDDIQLHGEQDLSKEFLSNTIDLKSINISDIDASSNLEESKNFEVHDLKKMSVNRLRSIVIEKGIVNDPSKLKKPELLKLLGIE